MSKSVLQSASGTLALTEEPGLHLCRQAQSAYLIVSTANVTDFCMNLISCSCTFVNMHDHVLPIYFRVLLCTISFLPFYVLLQFVRRTREYLFWTIWSTIAAKCIHCAPLPFQSFRAQVIKTNQMQMFGSLLNVWTSISEGVPLCNILSGHW